jgi:hypothetical protein
MADVVQIEMNLFPIKEVEVDGIQMGVLSDGSPYLTARGLARMCGVDHTNLIRLANNWDEEQHRPRGQKIKELLAAQGHKGDHLYRRTKGPSGETHAYTDAGTAIKNYRLLARYSFRSFIYNRVGYDPFKHIPDSWRNFHERILLNDTIPANYFSVFREIADLVVHMLQAGFPIDDHCVPDISVGQLWGKHWTASNLEQVYGARIKHPHVYPDWFPQSKVNPVDVWVYPMKALGDFRVWLYEKYIPKSFPAYLTTKVKSGVFLPSRAELLLNAVSQKTLGK